MKISSFIFFIVFSHSLLAQVERYTYHDDLKTKTKEVFQVKDTVSNVLEGTYTSYYINGNIESKGRFEDNETVGVWEFYYETGRLKMTGNLKKGTNDGYWTYFFENGDRSMEGEISNKKRRGPWKIYYESGALKEEGNFVDNKREGLWTGYYEDGNKRSEIDYTYGKGRSTEFYSTGEKRAEGPKSGSKNVGLWRYFFKNGNVQAEGLHENGKKTGDWKYYFKDGSLAASGTFKNNQAEGKWSYFHENGQKSSEGVFVGGQKDGYWGLFSENGKLKGETTYETGDGIYKEYYPSGKLKLEGQVDNDINQGLWKYYYEGGQLEGECNFTDGRGEYLGYYPDGTLQTKGIIDDGKKIGRWELYKNDGSLSGYYKPIYDQPELSEYQPRQSKKYGVGEYKFRGRRFKHFDSRINEFQGVILQSNPIMSFLGRVPFGVEFYLQERLGHEFEFEGIRDPFYTLDDDVALDEIFSRGYGMALKQKLYNPSKYGLWYFGHELRFSNVSHFANVSTPLEIVRRASASEQKIEYSIILGYRLMQNTAGKGFTVDSFVSLGTGYRNFDVSEQDRNSFDELDMGTVPLTFNFGLNIGYAFSFGSRGR
ncbi:MAG: toxin-antitoxin system YwqK family antitoxin [Bacteroidota bacterium]